MSEQYPRIETRKLNTVKAHPDGVRTTGMDEVFNLGKSLEHFGVLRPPVLNARTGHLIDGDVMVSRMRDLGAEECAFWVVDVPEEDEDAAHLALNNHCGEWQWEAVSKLLKDLQARGIALGLTGFHTYDTGPLLAADWKAATKGPLDGSDPQQGSFL